MDLIILTLLFFPSAKHVMICMSEALVFVLSAKISPRKRNVGSSVNRVRSMTEHDRTQRERTLTSESITSDKGRPRSFSGSDKQTSVKRPAVTTDDSHTASEDTNTEKKVVLIGK